MQFYTNQHNFTVESIYMHAKCTSAFLIPKGMSWFTVTWQQTGNNSSILSNRIVKIWPWLLSASSLGTG
jgi:hypothetical protein